MRRRRTARHARGTRLFGRPRPFTVRRRIEMYTDPLQHACIAAAVAYPLVPSAGRSVVTSAVAPAIAIDIDHVVAARSPRVRALVSLPTRPRTHSLMTAVAVGAVVAARAGPAHGWAAFGGLASHLLHDAGDGAAPTPVLWPFSPARQLGRPRQLVGTAALVLASAAINRAMAGPSRGPSASGAGGDTAPPRTA